MKTLYASEVTSKGGLYGHITSKNGALDTDVFMPTGTEDKDDKQKGVTPEQLFAASYAACLEGTIHHIAKINNMDLNETEVKAKVKAVQVEKGDLRFALDLEVKMPEVDKDKAQKILDEARANCPISKATEGQMEVNMKLV